MSGLLSRTRRAALSLALLTAASAPLMAAHAPYAEPSITVGIVLFDGVEIIDFAAPYEVFGQAGFGVYTLSEDGKPVETAMGLTVTPDHGYADAPALDVLLVPGGDVRRARGDERLLEFVRARAGQARHVLSVCTGVELLASAGLLDGLKATNFHPRLEQLARDFPKVEVVRDVRWADNGKIVTSAGLSSGIDAALHVVARLRGVDYARSTALELEYDWKPDGGFVRTRLADRYVPNLDIEWPADAHLQRVLSFGDEHRWRARFHTRTIVRPLALLATIAMSIDGTGEWTRDRDAGDFVWKREIDGRTVRMSLAAEARAADGGYHLDLAIDAS